MNLSKIYKCNFSLFSVIFVYILGLSLSSRAELITGLVTNEQGMPLSFANVFIKGTTNGTTTNLEGNYQLEVSAGNVEIVFKYIGYKTVVKQINVNQPQITLNVTLAEENYLLKEVVIRAGEDPAYSIIRNAIKKRKYFLNEVEQYSCNVYIKGMQRLLKWPKKVLGKEISIGAFIDSVTHIIYLSESVSKFNFKQPDQIREEMISSKVSGNSKAFSWNQASEMQFNFYENLMETGISPRGVISPIANNALFYYNYRLDGTFIENNIVVNKITVTPKRKNDPVFRGTIFIQDSIWRIHSLDLYLTRDAQIQFVDTLTIKQVYLPVVVNPASGNKVNDVWMTASSQFNFHFNVIGFEGVGNYVGIYSKYNLNTDFQSTFFKGEVMKVNTDANKKDSLYWASVRPVPLTEIEKLDYFKKDSLQTVRESKAFLDSLDKKTNKIGVVKFLFTGYNYRQRYKKQTINFSPLIQNIQFNTVEGLNFSLIPEYVKTFQNKQKLVFTPLVKYGISNKAFSTTLRTEYYYNRQNFSSIAFEGGKTSVQFNDENPIHPIVNTFYTLLSENNYMKIFDKSYGLINYKNEITNGININATLEYSKRSAIVNHTNYTLNDIGNREYSSNNPLNQSNDEPAFDKNQSLSAGIDIKFRIRQKYISRPEEKIIIGSAYPTLLFIYKKGFSNLFGSDVNYNLIMAGVEDEIDFGLLGSAKFNFNYGKFFSNKTMYFMDYRHFNGNLTVFTSFDLRSFSLLDYYSYSTNNEFFEAHFEHNFEGFIFNKIPVLRKLRLNEIGGFDFLHVPGKDDHIEISAGISKLNIIRIDFVAAFVRKKHTQTGIKLIFAGL